MAGPAALLAATFALLAVVLAVPRRRPAYARSHVGRESGAARPSAPRSAPVRILHLATAGGGGLAVLLLVPGLVGVVLAGLVAGGVWWRSRQWESVAVRRHRARLEAELPHVVDLMTAALAAGAAPSSALSLVTEVVDPAMADELRVWTTRLALGSDPVTVWSELATHPQLGRLGVTLQRSAESGAPVAAALLRLSEDLRAREKAMVEERVRQVEVRAAVPLGVCLLPSFVLVGVVPLVAGAVSGLLLTP